MERKSGVLMHLSSLFGGYSVGSFGREAEYFIDFLAESGFSYWQVLPFCMPDEHGSPYKSPASFGANPYFIDLPTLYEEGLLTYEELLEAKEENPYLCEYERLARERVGLLYRAAMRVRDRSEIIDFVKSVPELEIAAEFMAGRESVGTTYSDRLFVWQFIQYKFMKQWGRVKKYAAARGIKIIGDMPIYVDSDSADVWSHGEEFLLDERGRPTAVAGVPPDYFCEDGQLWGNPLYDIEKMRANGFSWWRSRIRHNLTLFDGVRIDHFRAFESFWSVPASAKSAKEGKWVKGGGRALVDAINEEAKGALIIAEDLGDITDGVRELVRYSGMPGMRVFQFAFLGDGKTPHLPHNWVKNAIAYTGTHDNNTLLGYVWELDGATRRRVFDYVGYTGEDFSEGVRCIIRAVMASHADTVIFPIQDILGFGADTRMNTPGCAGGNWRYRITREQLNSVDRENLRKLNSLYGRE